MMKYPFIALIISQLYCLQGNAQSIDMPIDRVRSLLCKKWKYEYAIYGVQKVYNSVNIPDSYYEFKRDNTFLYYSDGDKGHYPGTWEYIPEKKRIRFGPKGKYDTVFSLEENKLVTQIKVVEGTPHIFQVYKVSN